MVTTETRTTVDAPGRAGSPAYNVLVGLVTLGVLLQGLWAGLFVREGKNYQDGWVHVHALDGEVTFVLALVATILAAVKLRRTRPDLLAGTAVLTVLLLVEAYLGGLIGDHAGVTALHFPLAMAIMGLAVWLPVRAAAGRRR
jgi:heme A synthase